MSGIASLLINTHSEKRLANLNKILEIECDYKMLSEVLVFNNTGKPVDYKHRKLKVIEANYDVGLRSRWVLGVLASKQCLFVQDDDLLVGESVMDILHSNYLFDYDKLYGIYGRKIDAIGEYSLTQSFTGDVDIMLTRLACFDKSLIPFVLEAEDKILPVKYPQAKDFPYDDILLSYTSQSIYNKKPFVPVIEDLSKLITELPDSDGLHLDKSYMEKRKEIISICRRTLVGENIKYPVPATTDN